jgi:pantetheine-phosphate adenylyltransferase
MAAEPRIAIFPGTFDPLTVGHTDLIARGARLFDLLVVALLRNTAKQPRFGLDERVAMIQDALAGQPGLEVDTFDGLLADYARRRRATAVVRGLRSGTDLDYEQQIALTNRHLDPSFETVFLLPSAGVAHVSGTLVREILSLGGSVRGLVPPAVEARVTAHARGPRTRSL